MASPVAPGRLAFLGVLGLMFDFSGFIGGLFLGSFIVPKPRVALPR